MSNDNPLEFVTVDEMIKELKSRFNAVVIITNNTMTNTEEETWTWFRGGRIMCLGLAVNAVNLLKKTNSNANDGSDPEG